MHRYPPSLICCLVEIGQWMLRLLPLLLVVASRAREDSGGEWVLGAGFELESKVWRLRIEEVTLTPGASRRGARPPTPHMLSLKK